MAEPMIERWSPLADWAARLSDVSARSGGDLRVAELPFLTQVTLRGRANEADLRAACQTNLGFELPVLANTVVRRGDVAALWLGPDEWLITAPDGAAERLIAGLALPDRFVSVVDVSANRTVIALEGPWARAVLRQACPLDLHPRGFRAGRCAQSVLARAQIILEQLDDTPSYRLFVRNSFAAYVAGWLVDAAEGLIADRAHGLALIPA